MYGLNPQITQISADFLKTKPVICSAFKLISENAKKAKICRLKTKKADKRIKLKAEGSKLKAKEAD